MLKFDDNLKEANFSKVIGTDFRVELRNGSIVNAKLFSGCPKPKDFVAYTIDADGRTIYRNNKPSDTYTR